MIRLALGSVTTRLQGVAQLSALGWFVVVFVGWACTASAVRGDVPGVVLALLGLLAGFRWFGPSLRRDGGTS